MKRKINRKWFLLSIFLCLSICSALYFLLRNAAENKAIGSKLFTKRKSYFVPMKINGVSSGNIPYFIVNIENQTVITKIDLGYAGYIALSSDVIKGLTAKKLIGPSSSYGLKGRIHESDTYELEKIHTETMSFYPVLADEVSPECKYDANLGEVGEISESDFGWLGWRLFENFNLLIDHENSILALCDGLETLRTKDIQ